MSALRGEGGVFREEGQIWSLLRTGQLYRTIWILLTGQCPETGLNAHPLISTRGRHPVEFLLYGRKRSETIHIYREAMLFIAK